MSAEDRPAARRRAWMGVALAVLWLVLLFTTLDFAVNLVLRLVAAFDGVLAGYRSALLLSWKTFALPLLLIVTVVFAVAVGRAAVRRGWSRGRVAAALGGLAALAVFGWSMAAGFGPNMGANRWGFCRIFDPGTTYVELGWEGYPPMAVTTNSESFRDDEWPVPAPADGTIRVLLVGDSHVWGHGVPDPSGLLDRQLEARLNRAAGERGPRWDVWNIAAAPASFWYYGEAIRRIQPDAGARYAVLSAFPSDVTFVDEQQALADKGPLFCAAAHGVHLVGDLLWMVHHVSFPGNEAQIRHDPAVVARNRAYFEELLAFVRSRDMRLVVWQPLGALELFAPYRDDPALVFLDWRREIGLDCTPDECNWHDDPTLAYPDGHPLPATNGRIADALARTLQRLEAERGAADDRQIGAPAAPSAQR